MPSRSAETRAGSAESLRAGAADATATDAFAPTVSEKGDGVDGVDAHDAPPPDALTERKERARLAKARQAAVLAAMAARQKAFADTLCEREDDDRSADEEGTTTPFGPPPNDGFQNGRRRRFQADVADGSSAETVKDKTANANANATPCPGTPFPSARCAATTRRAGTPGSCAGWPGGRGRLRRAPAAPSRSGGKKSKTVVTSVGGRRRFLSFGGTRNTRNTRLERRRRRALRGVRGCAGVRRFPAGDVRARRARRVPRPVRPLDARASGSGTKRWRTKPRT